MRRASLAKGVIGRIMDCACGSLDWGERRVNTWGKRHVLGGTCIIIIIIINNNNLNHACRGSMDVSAMEHEGRIVISVAILTTQATTS
jgi:hypothetical protein